MLAISSKSKYGLSAALTLAKHFDEGLVQIKDIARQNNIPAQYLAQIFAQLTKSNIIQSVRGKRGGYKLSRSPTKITILEILEVLEGGFEFSEKGNVHDDPLIELFSEAEFKLKDIFQITLTDILLRHEAKKNIIHYEI
jgi:Rrf2 family protein